MTQDLHRLIYCSRNVMADVDAVDGMRSILAASRRNNASVAVTGALVFTAGIFAQLLEGPLPEIEKTFERIQADPRHADITVLQVSGADRRVFADWSMGFAGGERASEAFSAARLDRAFRMAAGDGAAAQDIMDLLRALVRTEGGWAA